MTIGIGIPDSLAQACKECGYVRVGDGGGWTKGASVHEWRNDVYGIPEDTLPKKGLFKKDSK